MLHGGSSSTQKTEHSLGHIFGGLAAGIHSKKLQHTRACSCSICKTWAFIINGEKSKLSPAQDVVFLGLALNSVSLMAFRRNNS